MKVSISLEITLGALECLALELASDVSAPSACDRGVRLADQPYFASSLFALVHESLLELVVVPGHQFSNGGAAYCSSLSSHHAFHLEFGQEHVLVVGAQEGSRLAVEILYLVVEFEPETRNCLAV